MFSVEICIPTNKEANEIERTLTSLNDSAQACRVRISVVIIYNGNSTIPICYESDYKSLNIRIVTSRPHALSAARNAALLNSSSEWVAFIDDDILCSKGYVESLLREIKDAQPNHVLAGRITLLEQEKLPKLAGKVWKTLMCDFDLGKRSFELDSAGVGANFVVHREFAMNLGGFNESLGRMGNLLLSNEDTDYFIKHIRHGGKVFYCGGLQVLHEFHTARSEYSWMIERMAWQGISDVVMGIDITRSELATAIENASLPGLELELNRLLAPPAGVSEFEARLNVVKNLQMTLSTFSKAQPIALNHGATNIQSHVKHNEYLQSELVNSKVIFIEFENNHTGNYEYVYSKFEKSSVHRIKSNPWIDPFSAANELSDWITQYKVQNKVIVFLTSDAIFWNHAIFREMIDELSESNRLIGYIHRTNTEIHSGVKKIGGKFRSLLMYGFTGPKMISERWNVDLISSPIPSFIESQFSKLQSYETYKSERYDFGLIGEFRMEKSYSYFLKMLRKSEMKKSSILMAGRSIDNSQQILKSKLISLNSNISVLDKEKVDLLEFDRNFFSQLNCVDVFVSGYSGVNEIAASGPVAEAIHLGKKILIDPKTWIFEDLLSYAPEALFENTDRVVEKQDLNRMKLVSSSGALQRLRDVMSNHL